MSEKKEYKIHSFRLFGRIVKYTHGTWKILNAKSGMSYLFQISIKDMWMKPWKNPDFMGGRYTLYGWMIFYFGICNIEHIELREMLAEVYNKNRQKGLQYMERFMKENINAFQRLQIQQDNMDRNCHAAPEMYENDVTNLLALYGYQCDEDMNIVSYYGIALEN